VGIFGWIKRSKDAKILLLQNVGVMIEELAARLASVGLYDHGHDAHILREICGMVTFVQCSTAAGTLSARPLGEDVARYVHHFVMGKTLSRLDSFIGKDGTGSFIQECHREYFEACKLRPAKKTADIEDWRMAQQPIIQVFFGRLNAYFSHAPFDLENPDQRTTELIEFLTQWLVEAQLMAFAIFEKYELRMD